MEAAEFNPLYETLVRQALRDWGFSDSGRGDLLYSSGTARVVLMRFTRKRSNANQETHVILLLRHAFMRRIDDDEVGDYSSNAHDYPVKLRPGSAGALEARYYRYRPMNLSIDDSAFDTIRYGSASAGSVRRQLRGIAKRVAKATGPLVGRCTPPVLLQQLQERGEDVWCERRWIEDLKGQRD